MKRMEQVTSEWTDLLGCLVELQEQPVTVRITERGARIAELRGHLHPGDGILGRPRRTAAMGRPLTAVGELRDQPRIPGAVALGRGGRRGRAAPGARADQHRDRLLTGRGSMSGRVLQTGGVPGDYRGVVSSCLTCGGH